MEFDTPVMWAVTSSLTNITGWRERRVGRLQGCFIFFFSLRMSSMISGLTTGLGLRVRLQAELLIFFRGHVFRR